VQRRPDLGVRVCLAAGAALVVAFGRGPGGELVTHRLLTDQLDLAGLGELVQGVTDRAGAAPGQVDGYPLGGPAADADVVRQRLLLQHLQDELLQLTGAQPGQAAGQDGRLAGLSPVGLGHVLAAPAAVGRGLLPAVRADPG
jgi:hypothetical protein